MAYRNIHRNILVNNFEQLVNVDNDDGSNHFNNTFNVQIGSLRSAKCDFGGHDLHNNYNMYLFQSSVDPVETGYGGPYANCLHSAAQGHGLQFIGNHIYTRDDDFSFGEACTNDTDPHTSAGLIQHSNVVYSPSGKIPCNGTGEKLPAASDIIRIAAAMLAVED